MGLGFSSAVHADGPCTAELAHLSTTAADYAGIIGSLREGGSSGEGPGDP